jgi:hypothetical protein
MPPRRPGVNASRRGTRRARTRADTLASTHILDLAVLLAGHSRPAQRDEWGAHLASEGDHDPGTWHKTREALGFMSSAVRFRLADAAELAWRPADTVLGSRTLTNLFVWGPVIVALFAVVLHDGRFGLVADVQDPGTLGVFLYSLIRVGRWWRAVKPSEPKARRVKAKRVAPSATWLLAVAARLLPATATGLLAVATWLLPAKDRARYKEEYQSELWEIAHTGSRRAQLAYAARQLLSAFRLRRGLRIPPRRGAAP